MDPVTIAMAAVPGIMKGIGSLFGRSRLREREDEARGEYNLQRRAYKDFDFMNPYEGMENQMEDMRVATQAAEFQAQEQQAGLAQTLEAFRGAGGGTGAAAIAQALAGQQAKNQQQIAAQIEQQEVRNEMMARQAGMQLQQLEARGAMGVQQMEFDRESTLLGMAQQQYAGAMQARAQNTAAFGEGLGAAGSLGAFAALGGFS